MRFSMTKDSSVPRQMDVATLNQLFYEFKGHFGRFVRYQDGHGGWLALQFTRGEEAAYEVLCNGVTYVAGSTTFDGVDLRAKEVREGVIEIVDVAGDLRIVCWDARCTKLEE